MAKNIYTATGNIDLYSLKSFTNKIATLNRRCARLGIPETVSFKLGESSEITLEATTRTPKVTVDVIHATITWGADIRVNGWHLAATVDAEGDAVLVYPVPGKEIGRIEKVTCEHCNTNRTRKYGYILENEDGNRIMVGKQCLKDYLGHDPASIIFQSGVNFNSMFFDPEMEEEEFGMRLSRGDFHICLHEFLAAVCLTVEQEGSFVTRKQVNEYYGDLPLRSTSATAMNFMESPRANERFRKEVQSRHWKKATEIIECVKSALHGRHDLNDYQIHLDVLVGIGSIKAKSAGFAASMFSFHHRELAKQAKALQLEKDAAASSSQYIGNIKERRDFGAVRLVKEHTFSNDYGPVAILTFEDESGNHLKWFKSGGSWWRKDTEKMLEIGETIALTATVKNHEIDKYSKVRTTIIQRGAITKPK
jgi:ribosomal protein S11